MPCARLVPVLFALLLISPFAAAQTTSISPLDETGVQPYGTYDGVRENISLSNGNLNIYLPLLTLPQRAGRTFALGVQYDSKTWGLQYIDNHDGTYAVFWQQELQDHRIPMITPNLRLAVPTLQGTLSTYHGYQFCVHDWIFTEATGSKHHFNAVWGCAFSGTNPEVLIADSDDSAGYRINLTNTNDVVVYAKDGTQFHFKDFQGYSYIAAFDTIVDTNGNIIQSTKTTGNLGGNPITSITDTVGRVFNIDFADHLISYKDANGASQSIAFTQLASTAGPSLTFMHPSGTDCGSLNSAATNPLGTTVTNWAVTIPDGASGIIYTLQFNPAGELTKITYPAGGYTKYDYNAYPAFYFQQPISCLSIDFREVVAKHECRRSDGNCGVSPAPTPEDTTTYTATISSRANQYMDVLSPDPSGTPNKTHYEFSVPVTPDFASLELNRYLYSGSSTLLRTIHTDYTTNTLSGETPTNDWSLPTRVTTTLNDVSPNLVSKIETDYDFVSGTNEWGTVTVPIDNPTEVREFDYGLLLARKTDTAWLKTGEYSLNQKHILDRRMSVTVSNGTGTQVAATSYEYDNYTEGLTSSGATQNQGEDNYRGNLTATARWLNTTNSFLPPTRYQFDDAGSVRKVTDPLSHSTTISFVDSWRQNSCAPASGQAASYPTTTTNALGQSTVSTYDSCFGHLATLTDQNLQMTTYTYDTTGRTLLATYPDHGSTTITYTDTAPTSRTITSAVSTTPAVVNKISSTTYDGLSRVTQNALTSDPDGSTYTDTTYDSLDRVYCVSNPYRPGYEQIYGTTDGITTSVYDALNRITAVQPPDHWISTSPGGPTCQTVTPQSTPANPASFVSTTYSGNCSTVTDQAGKARKSCSDALGRLTQVFEDPLGLNYETDYTYDALNNSLSVSQKGGSTNSGQWRPRSFSYDSLSRLTSATNPESGTITYSYDANGNLVSKTSPAPNQTGAATVMASYSYDPLNRLTQKSFSDGTTPTVKYGYDATAPTGCTVAPPALTDSYPVGRRTAMCDGGGSESWSHDQMGRPLTVARTTNGITRKFPYTYNLDGSLNTLTYPIIFGTQNQTSSVTYTQGGAGRPLQLVSAGVTYITANAHYTPSGDLCYRQDDWDGAWTTTKTFNNRLQPVTIQSIQMFSGTPPPVCGISPDLPPFSAHRIIRHAKLLT